MVSHYLELMSLKSGPWSQFRLDKKSVSMEENKQQVQKNKRSSNTQGNGSKELWYTVLSHLQHNNASSYPGVRSRAKSNKTHTVQPAQTKKENIETRNKIYMRSRPQAESRWEKVANCWYNQSYDSSRSWTTIGRQNTTRLTRQDQVRDEELITKSRAVLLCRAGGPGRQQDAMYKGD